MNVRELIGLLFSYDDDTVEVEIATCERKDEWYQVVDVEANTNLRGDPIILINTD